MNNTPRSRAIQLGIQLAAHAEKAGIQQKKISEITGYAPNTISRILTGKFPAKSEILCAIADAICVEIKIINCSEMGENSKIMWYIFTNAGQAYNPTQTPEFDKNFGRWDEFDTLEDAEKFRESYQ